MASVALSVLILMARKTIASNDKSEDTDVL